MRSGPELRELSAEQFTAELDALTEIYALAMNAPTAELPGRMSILARHARYPAFCAVVAVLSGGPGGPGEPSRPGEPGGPGEPSGPGQPAGPAGPAGSAGSAGSGRPGEPDHGPGRDEDVVGSRPTLAGFAYGFHGLAGQWWHDVVTENLRARRGSEAAGHWLGDSFEIAEVHVRPDHQGQGTGRAMMHALAAGRPERTAVLSTPDGQTRARRLYRSLGFADLLPSFSFPGGGPRYTIMGAVLPLWDEPLLAGGRASPSR